MAPQKKPIRNGHKLKKQGNAKALVPYQNTKGNRKVGRAAGTPNKYTAEIKQAVIEALNRSGKDGKGKEGAVGYFVWLSRAEPAVFGGLVGKILPTQVEVADKTHRSLTVEEATQKLRERGLPIPSGLIEQSVVEVIENEEEDEIEEVDD